MPTTSFPCSSCCDPCIGDPAVCASYCSNSLCTPPSGALNPCSIFEPRSCSHFLNKLWSVKCGSVTGGFCTWKIVSAVVGGILNCAYNGCTFTWTLVSCSQCCSSPRDFYSIAETTNGCQSSYAFGSGCPAMPLAQQDVICNAQSPCINNVYQCRYRG